MCGGGGCGWNVGDFLSTLGGAATSTLPAVASFAAGAPGAFGALGAGGLGAADAASSLGGGLFSVPGAASGLGSGLFTMPAGAGAGLGSLGGAESALGGSALFGPAAGTGTALGAGAAGSLGLSGAGLSSQFPGFADLGYSPTSSTLGTGTDLGALPPQSPATPVVDQFSPTTGLSGGNIGQGNIAGGLTNGVGGADTSGFGTTSGVGSTGASDLTSGNLNLGMGGNAAAGTMPTDNSGLLSLSGGQGAGYSPNGLAFGPNVPTPDTSGLYGITPMSSDAANVAATGTGAFQQPSFLDQLLSPVRNLQSGINNFLSPVGGTNGLNMLMRLGQSIYGAHQQNVLAGNLNNQLNSLQSIFSPTGAYAQQLQKQLMAQDAARGLRSQYGTRAVELQAALAKAEAQMLGGQGYTNLNTAAANASSGGLNSLFANAGNILGMTGTPATGNTKSNVPNIMLQL